MSSKLNTQDIIDLLVVKNEITKDEAEKFVAEFIYLIEKGLSTDELVKVKDFGTFKLTRIQERESIDVNTQEKIVIPSHRRVSFLPASMLKDLVNKPFAHFETTPLNDGIFLDGVSQDALSDRENDDDDRSDEDEPLKEETIVIADPIATIVEENEPTKIEKEEEELPQSFIRHIEDSIEKAAAEMRSINEIEPIDPEKESKVETTKSNNPKKPKSRKKLRRYILRWDVAIALFMVVGVGFAFNYYLTNNNPSKQGVEDSDIPKPIKADIPFPVDTKANIPLTTNTDSVKTKKNVAEVKTVKMTSGRTLRLIALDELGNREFWVYIYLKNKDKIKNPDVVPVGIELVLPNEDDFDMDASNRENAAKAKTLGDEEMKKFW